MRILIILIMLSFTGWLTGCATVPHEAAAPAQNQTIPVDNRVQVLSNIQHWDIDALIAIRNNAKRDSNSANMQWQQSKSNYNILLFGPMGSNSTKLTGSSKQVTLQTADGKTFHAKSPELLVAQQTGWRLPVSNLYYWVRGLPVPNLPADKRYDRFQHLTELKQDGWRVQFLRYTSEKHIDVPTKIFLDNPELSVKIIVSKWQF